MGALGDSIDVLRSRAARDPGLRRGLRAIVVLVVGFAALSVSMLLGAGELTEKQSEPAATATAQTESIGTDEAQVDQSRADQVGWGFMGLIIGVGVLLLGTAVWAVVRLWGQKGVSYDDVSPREQARRRQAADLLHDIGQPHDPPHHS